MRGGSRGAAGGRGGGDRLARALTDSVKDSPVEQDHDDARDVEGSHRRVDEEVGVVEGAEGRRLSSSFGVVHTESDRRRDGDRDDPGESKHHVDTTRVLVLGVLDRLCHGDVPVYTTRK